MIVFFCKGKLFQTENYIPFLVALTKYSKEKLLVIYPSKNDYFQIKKNKDIFEALNKVASVKHFYASYDIPLNILSDSFLLRFIKLIIFYIYLVLAVIHRNWILFFLIYKKVSLFYTQKIPYTNFLLKFNELFLKGKRFSILIYPYNFFLLKKSLKEEIEIVQALICLKST